MYCIDSRYSGDFKNDFTEVEKKIFCLTAYNHEYASYIKRLEEKYSEATYYYVSGMYETLFKDISLADDVNILLQKVEVLLEYHVKRIKDLEDRNFEKFENIDNLTEKFKLEHLYKPVYVKKPEGKGNEKEFKKVLVNDLLNESWFDKDLKLRIDERDEICAYHDSSNRYVPTCYYINLPENGEVVKGI